MPGIEEQLNQLENKVNENDNKVKDYIERIEECHGLYVDDIQKKIEIKLLTPILTSIVVWVAVTLFLEQF